VIYIHYFTSLWNDIACQSILALRPQSSAGTHISLVQSLWILVEEDSDGDMPQNGPGHRTYYVRKHGDTPNCASTVCWFTWVVRHKYVWQNHNLSSGGSSSSRLFAFFSVTGELPNHHQLRGRFSNTVRPYSSGIYLIPNPNVKVVRLSTRIAIHSSQHKAPVHHGPAS